MLIRYFSKNLNIVKREIIPISNSLREVTNFAKGGSQIKLPLLQNLLLPFRLLVVGELRFRICLCVFFLFRLPKFLKIYHT